MSAGTTSELPPTAPPTRSGFWNRQLEHYPSGRTRFTCLGIVVLATIVLYYQFYLAGAVATHIIAEYHMSFVYYVNISVVGYILGAAASFATGAADKYGRVNIITVGLFVVGLLCLFGVPLAHSKLGFGVVFVLIGVVEGIILVATPALIRDFSPQLGRASAMGFWTLGPVLGSLAVSIEVSNTSETTAWQDHYIAAGIVGLVVAALSAVFLRELAPNLRDQLMVSARDRALVEARAKGIDVAAVSKSPFRQMLKPDIILSAFAISVFLIIYYTAVGFFPVYFQTIFGFSQQDANGLGNWNWTFNALALLIVGFISDKFRVRKPFMVIGAVGAIVMTIIFLTRATHPDTSYYTFVVIVSLLAVSLGIAYAPWMASFTETAERRNPALAATGLAVWGLVIRIVIAVSVFIVPHMVNTVTTLVDKGPQAQVLAAKYASPLAAAKKVDPATLAALSKNPTDQTAGVKAISEITTIPASDVATVATVSAKHAAAIAAAQKVDPATLAALSKNPTDQGAGVKAISEITSIPAGDIAKVAALSSKYRAQLATAAKLSSATQAALAANPNDVNAQIKALSEITGVSLADVTTVVQLNLQHGPALQAGAAIDTSTATTLLTDPTNKAALTKAVGEVVAKLHVSQQQAIALITELKSIPVPKLLVVQANGPKVLAAAAQLKALGAIPASDLALVKKDGPPILAAKNSLVDLGTISSGDLALLQKDGKAVKVAADQLQALGKIPAADLALLKSAQKAAAASPKQWQHYFWVAVGGEVVFIPFIFLMAGYWSARKARRAEEEHEAWVEAELAKLNA